MAIKTNYTYRQIGENLKLFTQPYSIEDFPYLLLGCLGVSDTLISRYKNEKNIVASFDGLLIKKTFAYRLVNNEQLVSALEQIKIDQWVMKNAPAIIAVSDGQRVLAFDPSANETYDNAVSKLFTDYSFFSPMWGVKKYRAAEENPVDVKAAEKMANIHDEIRRFNNISIDDDVHDLNIFMSRLLFCFFAEDTGIFDDNVFTNSIREATQKSGSDLAEFLTRCFQVMDMKVRIGENSIYSQFPYVNGGLFSKQIKAPKMNARIRKLIIECGDLNWGEINPDIFGSMIQAVVSPELRSGLGIHYTSVPNIKKRNK
jgi:hypothetical protein